MIFLSHSLYILCVYTQLDNKHNNHFEGQLSADHHQFKYHSVFKMHLKIDVFPSRGDWGHKKFLVDVTLYPFS